MSFALEFLAIWFSCLAVQCWARLSFVYEIYPKTMIVFGRPETVHRWHVVRRAWGYVLTAALFWILFALFGSAAA